MAVETETETETRPDIETEQREEPKARESLLPPWSVILHNDDHNDMIHVVRSLMKSVPNLGTPRATQDHVRGAQSRQSGRHHLSRSSWPSCTATACRAAA